MAGATQCRKSLTFNYNAYNPYGIMTDARLASHTARDNANARPPLEEILRGVMVLLEGAYHRQPSLFLWKSWTIL